MKQLRYVILTILFLLPISSVLAQTQLFSHRCLGTPFPENSPATIHVLAKAGIHGAEVDLCTGKPTRVPVPDFIDVFKAVKLHPGFRIDKTSYRGDTQQLQIKHNKVGLHPKLQVVIKHNVELWRVH